MKNIDLNESLKLIESVNNKVLLIVVTSSDCPACKEYTLKVLPKIEEKFKSYLDLYLIDVNKIPNFKQFPPIATPISYFYIKNSKVFPIIRPGYAEEHTIDNEMAKFKRVLKGESFEQVFE